MIYGYHLNRSSLSHRGAITYAQRYEQPLVIRRQNKCTDRTGSHELLGIEYYSVVKQSTWRAYINTLLTELFCESDGTAATLHSNDKSFGTGFTTQENHCLC